MNEYENYLILETSIAQTKEWLKSFNPFVCELKLRIRAKKESRIIYDNVPEKFNQVMVKIIKNNFSKLVREALDLMENEEKHALSKCQTFVRDLQNKINNVIVDHPIHESGGE